MDMHIQATLKETVNNSHGDFLIITMLYYHAVFYCISSVNNYKISYQVSHQESFLFNSPVYMQHSFKGTKINNHHFNFKEKPFPKHFILDIQTLDI